MTHPTVFGGATPPPASYRIANSIRLSGNNYLSRTPSSSGNRQCFTVSTWAKRVPGQTQWILSAADAGYQGWLRLDNSNCVIAGDGQTAIGYNLHQQSKSVFRDPSAWYHVVIAINTASQFQAIYVNGQLQDPASGAVIPSQGYSTSFNTAGRTAYIGAYNNSGSLAVGYGSGYLADYCLIDGQALAPTNFGKLDANGVWVPIKYTGTYGANGCKLEFKNGSALGTDTSGNGNHWAISGLTAADQMVDTPTNNYCTMNPLDYPPIAGTTYATLTDGNLTMTYTTAYMGSSGKAGTRGTMQMPSGKYYWEVKWVSGSAFGGMAVGVANNQWTGSNGLGMGDAYSWSYDLQGSKYTNSVATAFGAGWVLGDVIGVAFDASIGKIWFSRNGVWQGVSAQTDVENGINPAFLGLTGDMFPAFAGQNNTSSFTLNFGQRPFAYTPPTGFKTLCTANLPAVTIPRPASHFNAVLASGASIKSSAEAQFPSFLEWIKDRANTNNHQLMDTVRGSSAVLQSNSTGTETTYSAPLGSSVGWVWNAGAAAIANTAGSITSQVSANPTAGFSVVTYTGNGTASATIGHGLAAVPKFYIVKSRTELASWYVYSHVIGPTKRLFLEDNSAWSTGPTWNDTNPTSMVFSISGSGVNNNASTYVAYCFAEIPGYSKFGSYVGNGSTDGPFAHCGFLPRWVMIKETDTATNWYIWDTSRAISNPMGNTLRANQSNSDVSNTPIDAVSNGFKLRSGQGLAVNDPGNTYIFAAFAEHPFGGANVAPTPAR